MLLLLRGIAVLRRIRWWLLAFVALLIVVVQDEWAWWSAISGSVGLAGFWVPWLADLVRDWTPSARRARAAMPSEAERIEAERQRLLRGRGTDRADREA